MLNLKQKLSQSSGNKLSSFASKVLLVAFWNSPGIIRAHFIPKGSTVTARYYSEVILKKKKEISSRKHAYIILTPLNPTFI